MYSLSRYKWEKPADLSFSEEVRQYDIDQMPILQRVPIYWQSDVPFSRNSLYPPASWVPSFLVRRSQNEFEIEELGGRFVKKVSLDYFLSHNHITWASPFMWKTIIQICPFINDSSGKWDKEASERYVRMHMKMPVESDYESDTQFLADVLDVQYPEDLVQSATRTVSKCRS